MTCRETGTGAGTGWVGRASAHMPKSRCNFGKRKDLNRLGLTAKDIKTLRALVDGQLNVQAAEAVAQSIGRERALEHLHGETLLRSKKGTNVIKARDLRLPAAAPKRRKSGKSNWASDPAGRAKVESRTAEREALGLPKRIGVAEAYEAVHRLREVVSKALGVELETVPPRAVVRMIDGAGDGTVLKAKGPGRKVVRVAVHEGVPLVAVLSSDDDPALLDKDRQMKPGTAQLVPRRHVRHEAAGDFKRTVDFYLGGDAEEEELSHDSDESEESEDGEEQVEDGGDSDER